MTVGTNSGKWEAPEPLAQDVELREIQVLCRAAKHSTSSLTAVKWASPRLTGRCDEAVPPTRHTHPCTSSTPPLPYSCNDDDGATAACPARQVVTEGHACRRSWEWSRCARPATRCHPTCREEEEANPTMTLPSSCTASSGAQASWGPSRSVDALRRVWLAAWGLGLSGLVPCAGNARTQGECQACQLPWPWRVVLMSASVMHNPVSLWGASHHL